MFKGHRRAIIDIVGTILFTVVIYFAVHAAIEPRIVLGQSMEPTLHTGEYVMLDKVTYLFRSPERGDIVVFRYPYAPKDDYIKRVIGLPGDHVQVYGGNVFVNGHKLSEKYIADPPDYTDDKIVPKGYLYVLGDNRDNSSDSHEWGLLPRGNIIGRAMFSYWPLSELSFLHLPSYPNVP
jgi:signal peptidase I